MNSIIINTSVVDNFRFVECLGKGSFGSVYKIINKKNETLACKVENKTSDEDKQLKQRLKNEFLIYKRLNVNKIDCVPKVFSYIETEQHNLMCMELLGKGLNTIIDENGGKLDMGTVLNTSITIINNIKKIHKNGIIHRDIKPNNFMFGINENESKLHVMDFGLSKLWYENGKHIQFRENRSMIGTPRYASANVHMGLEASRRDDIESIGYMLIYMATGYLPWQGLKKKTKSTTIDYIGEKKIMISIKQLCNGLPACFSEFMRYAKQIEFNEEPDYDYLIKLFESHATKNKIKLKYYWESE